MVHERWNQICKKGPPTIINLNEYPALKPYIKAAQTPTTTPHQKKLSTKVNMASHKPRDPFTAYRDEEIDHIEESVPDKEPPKPPKNNDEESAEPRQVPPPRPMTSPRKTRFSHQTHYHHHDGQHTSQNQDAAHQHR